MILIFDTETTGLPDRTLPLDDAGQPHIVQFGAVLADDDGGEVETLSTIVRPDGWTITDAAAAIHGITTQRALAEGIEAGDALDAFLGLARQARTVVAHHLDFDRHGPPGPGVRALARGRLVHDGTVPADLNLPASGWMLEQGLTGPKPPSLKDSYRHFFGEDLTHHHDALADARASARIFFHLRGIGVVP